MKILRLKSLRFRGLFSACLFISALFQGNMALASGTLYAILTADTNDPNIGEGVTKDLNNMGSELDLIASHTGMTLKKVVFKGDDFSRDNIKQAIAGITSGPDDMLLFYYSGHGFRTEDKSGMWPYLFFSNGPLDFEWVIEAIDKKAGRLKITLSDSCDSVVPGIQDRDLNLDSVPLQKASAIGYRKLFLETSGTISGTSSLPGETSLGPKTGSLFTVEFLKDLRKEVADANPGWDFLDSEFGSSGNGRWKPIYYGGRYAQTPYIVTRVKSAGGNKPVQRTTQGSSKRLPRNTRTDRHGWEDVISSH